MIHNIDNKNTDKSKETPISWEDVNLLREQYESAIIKAVDVVSKNYLARLNELEIVAPENKLIEDNYEKNTAMFRIDKMVYEPNEFATHKLASVLGTLSITDGTLFLLIDCDGKQTKFYLGVRNRKELTAGTHLKTLEKSLNGQFPGVEIESLSGEEVCALMSGIGRGAVASSSCVADFRDNEKYSNETFFQGLEKFALSMQDERYVAVIMADSLPQSSLSKLRSDYEDIYSMIATFAESQTGFNKSISRGVAHTKGSGKTHQTGKSENISKSTSYTPETRQITMSHTPNLIERVKDGLYDFFFGGDRKTNENISEAVKTETICNGKSMTTSDGMEENESYAENHNREESRSLTLTFKNKTVQSLLERIDIQLERMKEFESYGMWECAAYFIAPDDNATAEMAAATYKSIMSGQNTGVEISAINNWRADDSKIEHLHKYITNFIQPVFEYKLDVKSQEITAGSFVSGKELALHMGLPRRSVPGFPVIEHASFGKEKVTYSASGKRNEDNTSQNEKKEIFLGNIFDMGKNNGNRPINFDCETLSAHMFITGTTKAGKSNAVYHILSQLKEKNIPFLVIEPTKGEYKQHFKGIAKVYGTDPNLPEITKMLKINPFHFPKKKIHVSSHMDRLVELFNVCWPMYGAMSSILKIAIEKSYLEKGWNLFTSENHQAGNKYPTFSTLQTQIEKVINDAKFSDRLRDDFRGLLWARVDSLTTGIDRLVFDSEQLSEKELFEENAIIDLSTVGSVETKALIMGLLIIKLQEYRMSEQKEPNANLKHIVVLEEAHHLLKRTSTEQSMETANILGKSVEILSTAIAEMRTYGEGFLIVDQSPEMLDISVIRNTNTKLILRLPEYSDRELVGRAANLNDEQIIELAKLKLSVAAVYQNDWLEPILVEIPQSVYKEENSKNEEDVKFDAISEDDVETTFWKNILQIPNTRPLKDIELEVLRGWIDTLKNKERIKYFMRKSLLNYRLTEPEQYEVIYVNFRGRELFQYIIKSNDKTINLNFVENWFSNLFDFSYELNKDLSYKLLCAIYWYIKRKNINCAAQVVIERIINSNQGGLS